MGNVHIRPGHKLRIRQGCVKLALELFECIGGVPCVSMPVYIQCHNADDSASVCNQSGSGHKRGAVL